MEVPNQSLLLSTTFKVRETHPSSPAVFPSILLFVTHTNHSRHSKIGFERSSKFVLKVKPFILIAFVWGHKSFSFLSICTHTHTQITAMHQLRHHMHNMQ